MKYFNNLIIATCLLGFTSVSIWARPFRVDQIPNGSKFSCANCHVSSEGGGPRNAFGLKVEQSYLENGDVKWQASLAALDSDGDGITNGQELQDPYGTWRPGDPQPGNYALVTNPGRINLVGAPILTTPANNALGVSLTPTLAWNALESADTYRVEVSDFSDFVQLEFQLDQTTSTSITTTPLKSNTLYYWRVRGSNSEGPSDWSAVWTFQTKFSTPTAVYPTNNASVAPAGIIFLWNAVAGAGSYNLEISDASDFSTTVAARTGLTDTTVNIANLALNKTYYWRVSAGSGASQSDWSATSTFNTNLLGPALVSPVNGAQGMDTTVTLLWNKLLGFNVFNVEISQSADFSGSVTDSSGLADTSYTISGLKFNTRYYWRINAGLSPALSDWSPVWSFVTKLAPPRLLAPLTDSLGADTTLALAWNAVNGAEGYNVQVSTSANFSDTVFARQNISDTTVAVGGLNFSTQYYWRVSAGAAPGLSDWSEIRSFTTGFMPPSLLSPNEDSVGLGLSTNFSWNFGLQGPYKFEIQIDTSAQFNVAARVVDSMSYDTTGLSQLTTYYWRVRGSLGNLKGVWSQTRSFTTQLLAPAPAYPDSAATNVALSVNARWEANPRANNYDVQLSTNANFSTIAAQGEAIEGTEFTFDSLMAGTTYYWRVRARTGDVVSAWSAVRSFVTGLNIPILSLPANGATDQPLNLTLQWQAIAEAQGYHVQVAYDQNFTNIRLDEQGTTATSAQLTDLPQTTKFYWRVRAVLQSGFSGWSETRSFTTLTIGSAYESPAIQAQIAPNPASDELRAEIVMKSRGPARALIVDALGRVSLEFGVTEFNAGTTSARFDISSLPAGAYRLVIVSGDESRSIGFVKL